MKLQLLFLCSFAIIISIGIVSCESKEKSAVAGEAITNDSLIKRGSYLVTITGCDDCHTPKKMGPMGPEPDMSLRFSGFRADIPMPAIDTNIIKKGLILGNGDLTGWVGPWGASFAANISSDETGIGNWTEEQFKKAITEGKWKGIDGNRSLLPPMPWQNFSHLSDMDVKAIFAFLKSSKPIKNVEPVIIPFSDLK